MVKVKALQQVNFGVLEKHGEMINFAEGEVKELPDTMPYTEMVANAVEDGFLELQEGVVESLKSKILPKKEEPKPEKVEAEETNSEDKEDN